MIQDLFTEIFNPEYSVENYRSMGYAGQANLLGCKVEDLRTLDNIHYHESLEDSLLIYHLAKTIIVHKKADMLHYNKDTGNEYVMDLFGMKIYIYHCEDSESIEITYDKQHKYKFNIMCEAFLRFN